ncbi:hypothetical protein [Mesorhizobium sp. WSM2239]|uniref:Uncharacterized protein n=2 Tax=unclassified Mesorhizobium TaxID=325217 RepID=A0AAU8DDP7_9HYPH
MTNVLPYEFAFGLGKWAFLLNQTKQFVEPFGRDLHRGQTFIERDLPHISLPQLIA